MIGVYLTLLGLVVFVLGVAASGYWLRKHPSRANAERSSRLTHLLFFAGMNFPPFVLFVNPGLSNLDGLVGLDSLSPKPLFLALGVVVGLPGIYLLVASNRSLRSIGDGANAFRLTGRIVRDDLYQMTRNPMSLGYYLLALTVAFVSGSMALTIGVLFLLVPAHVFFLKYFEEVELELPFGEPYRQYKRKVPFLIPRPSNWVPWNAGLPDNLVGANSADGHAASTSFV